jgi:hypothetical protein
LGLRGNVKQAYFLRSPIQSPFDIKDNIMIAVQICYPKATWFSTTFGHLAQSRSKEKKCQSQKPVKSPYSQRSNRVDRFLGLVADFADYEPP